MATHGPSGAAEIGGGGTPDRFTVDLSGATLLGQFVVERRLGEGGMGAVYLGRDTNLGRAVVVKVPHARFLAEPGFRDRFEREIRGLTGLEHPHVVRILARGEHEGVPFFVLQYLAGGSLAERLARLPGRCAAPRDVDAWLEPLAATLDFVHRRGFVHRDIKPANILFDEDGNVFLSDFGIAKTLGSGDASLTDTGTGIGSPHYMAPEQVGGAAVSGAADQYALAASAFEALGGRPPFEGDTPLQVLVRKSTEEPPDVRERAPYLPPAATDVLRRALARRPEERFPSCAAFAQAFRDATARGAAAGAVVAAKVEGHAPTLDLPVVGSTPTAVPRRAAAHLARWRRLPLPARLGVVAALPAAIVAGVVAAGSGERGHGPAAPDAPPPLASAPPATPASPDPVPPPPPPAIERPPPPRWAAPLELALAARRAHRYGEALRHLGAALDANAPDAEIPAVLAEMRRALLSRGAVAPSWARLDASQLDAAKVAGLEPALETHVGDRTLRFVLVPPGVYRAGSPPEEAGRDPDEIPHDVRIDAPFYLQVGEVTNAQFRAFRPGHRSGTYYGGPSLDGDDDPVVRVSHADARAFAAFVTAADVGRGLVYRLPTEAEWEWAARAGGDAPASARLVDRAAIASWGDVAVAVLRAARGTTWIDALPAGRATDATSRKNRFGLTDLAGGVWEWCHDVYGTYPVPAEGADPMGDPRGPPAGPLRVLRGGGFASDGVSARPANRAHAPGGTRNPTFGFRLTIVDPRGAASSEPVEEPAAAALTRPTAPATADATALGAACDAMDAVLVRRAAHTRALEQAAAAEAAARAALPGSVEHAVADAQGRWLAAVVEREVLERTRDAWDEHVFLEADPETIAAESLARWVEAIRAGRGDDADAALGALRRAATDFEARMTAVAEAVRRAGRTEVREDTGAPARAAPWALDPAHPIVGAEPSAAVALALLRGGVRLSLRADGTYLLETTLEPGRALFEGGVWSLDATSDVVRLAPRVSGGRVLDGGALAETPSVVRVSAADGRFAFVASGDPAGTPWTHAVEEALRAAPLAGPRIALTAPKDRARLTTGTIRVEGSVEFPVPGATLRVNGRDVALDGNAFATTVALEDGPGRRVEISYGVAGPIASEPVVARVDVDTRRPVLRASLDPKAAELASDGIWRTLDASVALSGRADDTSLAEVVLTSGGREQRLELRPDGAGAGFQHDVKPVPSDVARPLEVVVQARDAFGQTSDPVAFRVVHDPLKLHQIWFVRAMEKGDLAKGDELETIVRTRYGGSVAAPLLARLAAWRAPPTVEVGGLTLWSGEEEATPIQFVLHRQGNPFSFTVRFTGLRPTDDLFVRGKLRTLTAQERTGGVPVNVEILDLESGLVKDEDSSMGGGSALVAIDVRDTSRTPHRPRASTGFFVLVMPSFVIDMMGGTFAAEKGFTRASGPLPQYGAGVGAPELLGLFRRLIGR